MQNEWYANNGRNELGPYPACNELHKVIFRVMHRENDIMGATCAKPGGVLGDGMIIMKPSITPIPQGIAPVLFHIHFKDRPRPYRNSLCVG